VHRQLKEDLKEAGLELQPKKSKCHIHEDFKDEEWDRLRGEIEDGILRTEGGEEVRSFGELARGMTVCNVPIGSEEFVRGYLQQKLKKIQKGFKKVIELLDPGRWPNPDIPTRQMLWSLTLTCLQFMGDYWIRHVRPDLTKEFAEGVDEGLSELLRHCVGINTDLWSDTAKERMRLPIRHKGCGLRQAADRRSAQFLGAAAQSLIHLMDRTDKAGNVIRGRFNTQPVRNLFGEGAFDFPFESPWEGVLRNSRPDGNIATGIHQAWSHLNSKFQEVASPEQVGDTANFLIAQPVERAGFYEDGSMAASVTHAVTEELEQRRMLCLGEEIDKTCDRGS